MDGCRDKHTDPVFPVKLLNEIKVKKRIQARRQQQHAHRIPQVVAGMEQEN